MSCKIILESLEKRDKRFIEKTLRIEDDFHCPSSYQTLFEIDEDSVYVPYNFGHSNFHLERQNNIDLQSETSGFVGKLRSNQIIVRNNCLKILNKQGSVILAAEPGFGKTITTIEMICKINVKTIIVVKQTMIAKQWVSAIQQYAPEKKIQLIKNNYPIDKDVDIYIVNPIILKPQTNIAKQMKEIKREHLKHIKFVVVDEMHQIVSKIMLRCFFKLQPDYIIGLSATPRRPKNDPYQKAIEWFFGKAIVGRELLKKHTVYYVKTNFEPNEIKYTRKGVDWNHVLTTQAENCSRNLLIANLVMCFPERIWLILVKRVDHATRLKKIFNDNFVDCETLTGSKIEFDRKCKILIGTTSKIGVGFDHAPIDALFVAADIVEYFEQFLGRCMRRLDTEPIVFDLDDAYSILHRHFETRLKKYQKHGGIIESFDEENIFDEENENIDEDLQNKLNLY